MPHTDESPRTKLQSLERRLCAVRDKVLLRLAVVLTLAFAASSCAPYEFQSTSTFSPNSALPSPSSTPVLPQTTSTPAPTNPSDATPDQEETLYESVEFGFRLPIPNGFSIEELPLRKGILLAIGFAPPSGSNAEPAGIPMGITVYEKSPDESLLDWFSDHVGSLFESGQPTSVEAFFYDPIIQNHNDFKGEPALQYESGNRPVPFETVIDRGGWAIGLYYLRDYPQDFAGIYEQLLSSLELFQSVADHNPSATPTMPPATPTVCLDSQASPRPLPPRQTPLEVQFLSDGNLWVWEEASGVAEQITDTGDAGSFTFSKDGQVIAFMRGPQYEQAELWGIHRDGTGLQLLLSAEQLYSLVGPPTYTEFPFTDNIVYVGWLEGTHQLTFEIQRGYNAVGGCCESGGYWQVNVDTGELSPWTPPPAITSEAPHLVSPDGSQVAVIHPTSLSLMNADGSNVREAVFSFTTVLAPEGGALIYPHFEWANDSRALLAVTFSPDEFSDDATFTIWRIGLGGSSPQTLNTLDAPSYWVSLSPNQEYVAYKKRVRPMTNIYEMHLATLDGSQNVIYQSQHGLDFLGWHPDAYHFVYHQWNVMRPFLGSVCGGGIPLLTAEDTPATQLRWIDGTRFLFAKGSLDPMAGPRELRLGQIDGSSLLIGSFNGDRAQFTFNVDAAALGLD